MVELYYDFHIHSCLSPCAEDDMTPNNIVNMAALAGLEAIAVADHNSCLNLPAVKALCDEAGLLLVPAMELTTAEEAHILCFLPDVEAALDFSRHVRARLPDIPNNPDIFGEQTVMNERDEVTSRESIMLAGASDIGVYEAAGLLRSYGGVALPAHVDRPSFSIISNLGFVTPDMGFASAEVSRGTERQTLLERHPALRGMRLIADSDAHSLGMIYDAENTINIKERSAAAVIDIMRGGG